MAKTTPDLKGYEMMVVLHPDLEIDLETPQKQITKLVEARGGKITSLDVWGKRKLAYPIKKSEYGIYIFHRLDMPAAEMEKLNQELNIQTEVLRYLIVEFDPDLEELKQKQAERAARLEEESDQAETKAEDSKDKEG